MIHERQLASREIAPAREGTLGILLSNDWVSNEIKAAIILLFSLLDEIQRRQFARLESIQFGHGGDTRIADLLGINPHTVSKGRQQILAQDSLAEGISKLGAGRPGLKKSAPQTVSSIRI